MTRAPTVARGRGGAPSSLAMPLGRSVLSQPLLQERDQLAPVLDPSRLPRAVGHDHVFRHLPDGDRRRFFLAELDQERRQHRLEVVTEPQQHVLQPGALARVAHQPGAAGQGSLACHGL